MTHEELEHLLAESEAATRARDRRLALILVALSILATIVPIVLYLFFTPLSKAVAVPYYASVLAGFIALALYVLLTTRSFHGRTEAKCPYCGASLGWVREIQRLEAFGGFEKSETVTCRSCHQLLVDGRPKD